MERILSFVEKAGEDGDKLLVGGKRLNEENNGYFIEPTAVLAKSNNSRTCQKFLDHLLVLYPSILKKRQ